MGVRFTLLGFLLLSCSGEEGPGRLDPEICDDDVDNNGDGLVDCEDEASCGGLVCRDDPTVDTAVEPPDVEILYNEESCCDFTFDCPGQDTPIGSFSVINHSLELDGFISASCELVGPSLSPIEFQPVGSSQLSVPFLVDANLYADSSVEIGVFFACKPGLSQDFATVCRIEVETDEETYEKTFPIAATAAR